VRSRLEAVGEAKGPEIGLLDEVVRIGRALRQSEREAVQGIEVGERLQPEVSERLGAGPQACRAAPGEG